MKKLETYPDFFIFLRVYLKSIMETLGKYEKALQYEIFVKEEYQQVKNLIQKGKIIFDLGSHMGFFTERCLSLNPHLEIFAFEPVSSLYEIMKQRLSSSQEKIHFFNQGIGTKTEKIPFFFNPQKTMQSSKYSSFLNPHGEEKLVEMITLPEIFEEYHLSHVDLLKMDIEGMEFEVLSSRKKEIFQKIGAMMIELHFFNESFLQQRYSIENQLSLFFSHKIIQKNPYNAKIQLAFFQK